jgi:hypothetical protein
MPRQIPDRHSGAWQDSEKTATLLEMRTDLDHLPLAKRQELARIVEILFAEFEDALKGSRLQGAI